MSIDQSAHNTYLTLHYEQVTKHTTYIIRREELIDDFVSKFVDILILMILQLLNFLQS